MHAHNNQQLAYANTIEALVMGVNRLDATIYSLGRGAGNCALELLLGFLRNPKYDIRPVLKCIEEIMLPLQKKITWGYNIPYMVTGQLNLHPRAAIKVSEGENPSHEYLKFYDKMLEEES